MNTSPNTTWLAMQHPYGAKPWLVVEQSTHLPICAGIKIENAAHLIAASPDLLEALRQVKGWMDARAFDAGAPSEVNILDWVNSAIAKAEGR